MVSNVLGMEQPELIELLKSLRKKYADDPEYAKLRADLPKGWPI
jgi:hypothetical protein